MNVQNPSEQFSPADEVEALRAELAQARRERDEARFDLHRAQDERDIARAERREARAALAQIATMPPVHEPEVLQAISHLAKVVSIARAALGGEK